MRCSQLLALLSALLTVGAGTGNSQQSLFSSLASTHELALTIEAEWDTVQASRGDEDFPAKLTIDRDGLETTWHIEVQKRGRFRMLKCGFPPLWLKFKKDSLEAEGYKRDFRKIKLVSHCIDAPEGLTNLHEELLVYELYQILTDESYRVVRAKVTYKNASSNQKTHSYCLLLEPNPELSSRLNGVEKEDVYNFPSDSIEVGSYNRVALFQFMVGNPDWTYNVLRNFKLISSAGLYRLVPYDFDYSGIVNASYLPPYANDDRIRDKRDRIYLGQFFIEHLPATREEFRSKREQLLAHIDQFAYLRKTRRKQLRQYLEQFFGYIEDPSNPLSYKTVLSHADQ